jgi:hypothetical protein
MRLILLFALFCAAIPAHAASTPLERHVTAVYKQYAWTVVFSDLADTPLEWEGLPGLKRIFADDLARALRADRLCAERTKGICLLGETILWGSQDPIALELTVEAKAPNVVDVCFKNQAAVQSCMSIKGGVERGRARIRDIVYSDGYTLRALLKLAP